MVIGSFPSACELPLAGVRASSRSATGFVAVCVFSSFSAARACASSWALALPAACRGVVVRPFGSGFALSVPVVVPVGFQFRLAF